MHKLIAPSVADTCFQVSEASENVALAENAVLPQPIKIPPQVPPVLSVVVHTEEEFDWKRGFSRENTSVSHISNVYRLQEVFDKHAVKPVYLVDHPIAAQKSAYEPLKEIADSDRAEIGAHLHPWVSPPFIESVSTFNSYPGNLDRGIEYAKLKSLTQLIEEKFGKRPTSYLAGRYGNGPNSVSILSELGYTVDVSAAPAFDFSDDGGPNYFDYSNYSVWLDEERTVLGIPNSGAFVGLFSTHGPSLIPMLKSVVGRKIHLGGILSKLALFDRLRLSPEDSTQYEMRCLTNYLLKRGVRHFVFSFHSPSIKPGCTPYVQSELDLRRFLNDCDRFCDYFKNELGGVSMTASEYRNWITQYSSD